MLGVEAMIQVIVDQGARGVCDSLLNRLHLLRDFKAGLSRLDHVDHGAKMPVGAFQPGSESGMGCVHMRTCHEPILTPPGG